MIAVWDQYRSDLRKAIRTSPGREKGLLVANFEAEREIYGKTSLSLSTLKDSVKDIHSPDEARFQSVLDAQERLSIYLSNIQTRYLRLRETIRFLQGNFFLFKQYQFVENLLNDISCGTGKRAAALRQRIISNSHRLLLGEITLDEEGDYIHVRVSDKGKEVAFKTVEAIRDRVLQLKTKIAVARDFMEEHTIHLKAYEEYLDGIEGELCELIRSTQRQLYKVDDSESWQEMREFLAQGDDDFLQLIEALPNYEALLIDEDAFHKEENILLSGGE